MVASRRCVMGSCVRICIRSLQVVRDVRRLMDTESQLERGLNDRQLRILVIWHFGMDERVKFNRFTLSQICLMAQRGSLWTARNGISHIAYEVHYRNFRPGIPKDLGERMANESRIGREFYVELDKRIAKARYVNSCLREGDVKRFTANGRSELIRAAT